MSSQNHESTLGNAFLPTDFMEFLDCIIEASNQGKGVIERVVQIRLSNGVIHVTQGRIALRGFAVLEALMAKRRDLDVHYGWILVSDVAFVYKSIGGRSESGAAWAR